MNLRCLVYTCSVLLLLGCLTSCATDPALVSLEIQPNTQTLNAIGETVQFKVIGTYQRGSHPPTTKDMTSECVWHSSDAAVATISTAGVATAVGSGTATITASYETTTIKATANLTVKSSGPGATRDLTSLDVVPASQTVKAGGQTAQFIAIGTFTSSPTSEDMTNKVTWTSSSPNVATVNNAGLATAVGEGTATISARVVSPSGATVIGKANFTATGAGVGGTRDLISISMIPTSQTVSAAGQTAQFMALGNFSSSPTTEDLTHNVLWDSSSHEIATVNSSGLVTAVGQGTAAITATTESSSGATIVGVASFTELNAALPKRELLSISIVPNSQALETTGETAQFLAVGTFSSAPVTEFLSTTSVPKVTWASSAQQVATIDSAGLATARGVGTTTITASATAINSGNAIIGTATLTEKDGPTPTVPLLTVVKLGTGANTGIVTSDPSGINCAAAGVASTVCSNSFPYGSTVTLTATQANFRAWSANCVVAGVPNQCRVTVGINTVVGAIFD